MRARCRGSGAVQGPEELAVRQPFRPRHPERPRLSPEAAEGARLRLGHGAQDADAALEHHLGARHAGQQRDLRVPVLRREQGSEEQPVVALLVLGDLLLRHRQARAPALALPRDPLLADLLEQHQPLVGSAGVDRLLHAAVVVALLAADHRAVDLDGCALPVGRRAACPRRRRGASRRAAGSPRPRSARAGAAGCARPGRRPSGPAGAPPGRPRRPAARRPARRRWRSGRGSPRRRARCASPGRGPSSLAGRW